MAISRVRRPCCGSEYESEHQVTCPFFAPPLTHEEIRQLRGILSRIGELGL